MISLSNFPSIRFTHIGMPVELAQSTRFECHISGSNSLANREILRVNTAELTTRATNRLSIVLKGTIDESRIAARVGFGNIGYIAIADGAVDDVGISLRELVEDRFVDAEILGEDIFGGVSNPVVDVEGGSVCVSVL